MEMDVNGSFFKTASSIERWSALILISERLGNFPFGFRHQDFSNMSVYDI